MPFKNHQVKIIAEAGVNHNGCIERAMLLVDAAADAGADFVKFQTFKAAKLVTKDAVAASYQTDNTGATTQFEMLRRLELSEADHVRLIEHAAKRDIQFLSTGFDNDSVKLLDSLKISLFKIPSGEITNYPLIRTIAACGKPVVVSTGMANLKEISQCLQTLESFGVSKNMITVLHCNTQYPTPMVDVNLRAMRTIGEHFPEVSIGYSDHTLGIEIPVAAVALGATLIEKHFTVDKSLPGPDHIASLDPVELKAMVDAIRNIELAMGNGVKEPSDSERPNMIAARKSIVAATAIKAGTPFTEENLTAKRPGSGRSPMDWTNLIGTEAQRDYGVDEQID